ncbi:MAG: ABC transporter substrate-binding protein [Bacteroidales bacterium]|nr:ABC transporter substrate-binding protein [Bacteroidales bacterium]
MGVAFIMNKNLRYFPNIIWLLMLLVVGCNTDQKRAVESNGNQKNQIISPEFAQWYSIEVYAEYKKLIIKDPWSEKDVLAEYYLVPRGHTPTIDSLAVKIDVPVQKVVSLTSAYIGFLKELGSLEVLSGISDKSHVYSAQVHHQVDQGKTFEFGEEYNLQWENLIQHNPDALFVTAFPGRNPIEQYHNMGINAVYLVGWQEKTPLARAEWIKVIGLFTGKEKEADFLFEKIKAEYKRLNNLTQGLPRPKVLDGFTFKNIWYLPGGQSYKACFYKDAGSDYIYNDDPEYGDIIKDFETIIEDGHQAPIWFYPRMSDRDIRTVMDEDQLQVFKAFRDQQIYYQDARLNPEGGNEYWEKGPARPDLVLKDLISIFHPDILPEHKLYFFRNIFKEERDHYYSSGK